MFRWIGERGTERERAFERGGDRNAYQAYFVSPTKTYQIHIEPMDIRIDARHVPLRESCIRKLVDRKCGGTRPGCGSGDILPRTRDAEACVIGTRGELRRKAAGQRTWGTKEEMRGKDEML